MKNQYSFLKEIIILLRNESILSIGDINYIICDDPFILEMNNKYLKKNFYTDVITFNYTEKKYISGDIYISFDRVLDNSKKWHQTLINELKRVMIHSLLHLLGYNDDQEIQKNIMKKKEEFYLILFQ
ncbi:rRNA maturation RNase YbeY [Blattabacterium cuenoti]|uniref:rRNA maturation RNase YbeY n=1 Tax=Blattabacterium cuenoti TaxID=1653831 RepID=UPI001EEA92B1|nr:rRNA maturation RNase YbeY [Blattabacterium cuenoti]